MATWVVWGIFFGVVALLGFVGYHFSVRMLRWVGGITGLVLTAAVTAYGLRHAAATPPDFQSSFALGANKVGAVIFAPLRPGRKVPAPGRAGWAAIAVVLVFGYRMLESWALHWQAPELDTAELGKGQPSIRPAGAAGELVEGLTDGQRHSRLAAEVSFRLDAMEVRAPALLPGGSRAGGLATIAESSGVSGGGLAGAIIRFFGMLWPNPRRVQLHVWVESAARGVSAKAAAQARRTTVTVDLDDPRTGATISTKTLAAATIDEAATRVAGYVARQIFDMDPATPQWCVGLGDGSDLSALLRSRQERVPIKTPYQMQIARSDQIKILKRAVASSHCAGVVRYDLAQLYSIRGHPVEEHLTALWLHAVNREQHRRFYRGRYRLGMSLEMIANPSLRFARREPAIGQLREILAILRRCGLTKRREYADSDILIESSDGKSWELSPELCLDLLNAAQAELRTMRRQLALWHVLWAAFAHRDERAIWAPYLSQGQRLRQSFRDGTCVAELLVAIRRRQNEERRTSSRTSGNDEAVTRRPGPHRKPGRLRMGIRVASAIGGNDKLMWSIVQEQPGSWPPAPPSTDKPAPEDSRDRVRWRPWQHRTASWQAAYNTACLYAALASESPAQARADWADRVVLSLERAVNNTRSELERASDWISQDPDFLALRSAPLDFPRFAKFLAAQKQADYPDWDPNASGTWGSAD